MPLIELHNKKVARLFAETPHFVTVGPFQPTGGWITPLYPDTRKVFTKPGNLDIMADEMVKIIRKEKIRFDLVCGGATAGLPVATLVASKLKKPFIYVRKKKKEGGLCLAVEGNWPAYKKGSRVLLIDDAFANGTSKKAFIKNLKEVGLTVRHAMVIGHRGSPGGDRWTKTYNITAYSLVSIDDMMDAMLEKKTISPAGAQLLRWYSQMPNKWHKDPEKMAFFRNYKKTHKKGSTRA